MVLVSALIALAACVDLSYPNVDACPAGGCADGGAGGGGSGGAGPQDGNSDVPLPDTAPLRLEPGSACTGADECLSGFCVDGVCCLSDCDGICRSCKLPGKLGICSDVENGADPEGECAEQAASTCGTDGTCDGLGACRRYQAGTICAGASCADGMETSARTCDGKGVCGAPATRACAPYGCAGNACALSCTATTPCKSPAICNAGSCGLKTNGAACTANTECVSGICAQGACCASACSATCKSCNLPGSAGTCTNVPAGADPVNSCQDQGGGSCGLDGFCNGSGACRFYVMGTSCALASCSNGSFTPARTCNGSGTCSGPASVSCGKYQCGSASCRTTCRSNAECAGAMVCGGGACGGLKGEYFDNMDFTALRATRTDAVVNFSLPWDSRAGVGSPHSSIAADTYSVRWTGTLTAPATGTYTIYTRSDDRVRLTLDGIVRINNWSDHSVQEDAFTVTLQKDRAYNFQLDWVESTEHAVMELLWSSSDAGITRQIIPTSALTPAP
ncbi:MAG TPA: PA14 domain-containing protein [Polyangia bacterium]